MKKCQIGSLLKVPDLSETSCVTAETVTQTALRCALHLLPDPSLLFSSDYRFACSDATVCLKRSPRNVYQTDWIVFICVPFGKEPMNEIGSFKQKGCTQARGVGRVGLSIVPKSNI